MKNEVLLEKRNDVSVVKQCQLAERAVKVNLQMEGNVFTIGKKIFAATVLLLTGCSAEESSLKSVIATDWVRYERTSYDAERDVPKSFTTVKVHSKEGKMVKVISTSDPKQQPSFERIFEFDLSKPKSQGENILITLGIYDSPDVKCTIKRDGKIQENKLDDTSETITKGKKTKETIEVAGKKYNCIVSTYTIETKRKDWERITTAKVWTSKDIPAVGAVKVEQVNYVTTKYGNSKWSGIYTLVAF